MALIDFSIIKQLKGNAMKKYRQPGLFDEEFRREKLEKQGDPLVAMDQLVNWEIFRPILNRVFQKVSKGPGGRPPYDYIMMFKILILQRLYNLSDEQMEYQINDRISFTRFLGLRMNDVVPDQNTIWLFREQLTRAGAMRTLFKKFDHFLEKRGLIAHKGTIVDASFVETPRQRNSREENESIKNGVVPEEWKDSPNKLCQKDTDARWVKKHGVNHYGYKNHIKVDRKSKLIRAYATSDASVHDSQQFESLLDARDSSHDIFADSAYAGEPIREVLKKYRIRNRIHEKGYRGNPLTEAQKERNRKKSKIRARVEHVFGFIVTKMNGKYSRAIGLPRNDGIVGLMNLTYNLCRYIQLCNA